LPMPKVGTAGETGSGLGLRISTELAQRNNGSISIESEINKGTEVKIGFPKFSKELQPT
jgi:two-component system, sensor histidine kinase and response regulator